MEHLYYFGVKFMESNHEIEKSKSVEDYKMIISKKDDEIEKLNSELSKQNLILSRTKSYLFDLEYSLNINSKKSDSLESKLKDENNEMKSKEVLTENYKKALELMKTEYYAQISQIKSKDYCISCYKEKVKDNDSEINYLKTNVLKRKLFTPLSYIYIMFKSHPSEISLNLKLYGALKNSKCFDVGYYLNNNLDLINSNWTNSFSPELHFVLYGFDEGRIFNKKYFNRNSKVELLDYIKKCGEK